MLRVRFHFSKPQGFHGTGVTPCSVKPNRCLPICRLAGLVTSKICRRVAGSEGKRAHDWAALVNGMCTRHVGGRPQEPTPSHCTAYLTCSRTNRSPYYRQTRGRFAGSEKQNWEGARKSRLRPMVRRSFLCMPQRLLETGQEQAHVLSTYTQLVS